ncbi:hypothetical protein NM09_04330 [Vibrio caribbeanicus]|uniref:Uncharacterized protein n=1 Tax=Vibrio caribbeanicus TaxID=701175 RepID=A0ACC4NZA7_9VIBR|nr:hypothetical protein NM09_04330 [Vibrio caribbeanicus]
MKTLKDTNSKNAECHFKSLIILNNISNPILISLSWHKAMICDPRSILNTKVCIHDFMKLKQPKESAFFQEKRFRGMNQTNNEIRTM